MARGVVRLTLGVMSTVSTTTRTTEPPRHGRLGRSRWAAIGAAVGVTLGAGGLTIAGATSSDSSSIISITPTRILDTRDPVDLGLAGPFVSAVGQDLQVTGPIVTSSGTQTIVPHGATGVLLNVTVVLPTAAGFVSIRPAGTPGPPETSNLNFEAGDITPNAVFVALPTDGPDTGKIEITYDAFGTPGPSTDILGDVVGYTMGNPDAYTKAEADAMFLTDADAYTRAAADQRFLTEAEAQARFAPSFAVVNQVGDLERGRRVLTSELVPSPPADPGYFNVTFDHDVSACAPQVTAGHLGYATATHVGGDPRRVVVRTFEPIGPTNLGFTLTVHC
jgi:hypothetical protein